MGAANSVIVQPCALVPAGKVLSSCFPFLLLSLHAHALHPHMQHIVLALVLWGPAPLLIPGEEKDTPSELIQP